MRRSEAAELIKQNVEPRWDELRSARVHKRVLQGLRAPPGEAAPRRGATVRGRAAWIAAAVAIAAALALLVIARGIFSGTPPPTANDEAPSRQTVSQLTRDGATRLQDSKRRVGDGRRSCRHQRDGAEGVAGLLPLTSSRIPRCC